MDRKVGKRRNGIIGSSAGSFVGTGWGIYSQITTAKDLPEDAQWLASMIADPPVYAPWLLALVSLLCLVGLMWDKMPPQSDEPSTATSANTFGGNSPAFAGNTFNGPVSVGVQDTPYGNDLRLEVAQNLYVEAEGALTKMPPGGETQAQSINLYLRVRNVSRNGKAIRDIRVRAGRERENMRPIFFKNAMGVISLQQGEDRLLFVGKVLEMWNAASIPNRCGTQTLVDGVELNDCYNPDRNWRFLRFPNAGVRIKHVRGESGGEFFISITGEDMEALSFCIRTNLWSEEPTQWLTIHSD